MLFIGNYTIITALQSNNHIHASVLGAINSTEKSHQWQKQKNIFINCVIALYIYTTLLSIVYKLSKHSVYMYM